MCIWVVDVSAVPKMTQVPSPICIYSLLSGLSLFNKYLSKAYDAQVQHPSYSSGFGKRPRLPALLCTVVDVWRLVCPCPVLCPIPSFSHPLFLHTSLSMCRRRSILLCGFHMFGAKVCLICWYHWNWQPFLVLIFRDSFYVYQSWSWSSIHSFHAKV